MAIYHCSFQIIKHSEGRSVCAAAAYRSGEDISCQYDGNTYRYSRKGFVTYKELMLPPQANPNWTREELWNAVEKCADNPRDRLARECLVALPIELAHGQQVELVHRFGEWFRDKGMCVDICCHNPPIRDDLGRPIDSDGKLVSDPTKMPFPNPHAHILLTLRPIGSDGKFEKKSSTRYICKRGSEERLLSGKEYKEQKA